MKKPYKVGSSFYLQLVDGKRNFATKDMVAPGETLEIVCQLPSFPTLNLVVTHCETGPSGKQWQVWVRAQGEISLTPGQTRELQMAVANERSRMSPKAWALMSLLLTGLNHK